MTSNFVKYGCFATIGIIFLLGGLIAVITYFAPADTSGLGPHSGQPKYNDRQIALMETQLTQIINREARAGLKSFQMADDRLILVWDEGPWSLVPFEDKQLTVTVIGNQFSTWRKARGETPGMLRVTGYRSGKRLALWSERMGFHAE